MKRNGSHFVVTNKDNYPAESADDINNLIASCLDIKVDELFTDNPSNHKDLGVMEEDAKYVVKFLKQGSELMVGVIIGKGKERGTWHLCKDLSLVIRYTLPLNVRRLKTMH